MHRGSDDIRMERYYMPVNMSVGHYTFLPRLAANKRSVQHPPSNRSSGASVAQMQNEVLNLLKSNAKLERSTCGARERACGRIWTLPMHFHNPIPYSRCIVFVYSFASFAIPNLCVSVLFENFIHIFAFLILEYAMMAPGKCLTVPGRSLCC